MAEKEPEHTVDYHANHHYSGEEASKIEARRGAKVNEASDLYGDVQTAEEYGYVSRG
jgi:amino acid transporter